MKTKRILSAIPIYIAAAMCILFGLVLPLYKFSGILLTAARSAAAYLAAKKFLPGREAEIQEFTDTSRIDKEPADSMEEPEKLRKANAQITSPTITAWPDRMEKAGKSIPAAVARKPEHAGQVRKYKSVPVFRVRYESDIPIRAACLLIFR